MFTAISRTNLRATRDLVHTKISPSHAMSDGELAVALDAIEREYGIPRTMPRCVVEHHKGDRAPHFHVLWPLVDPESGRAIRSNENFLLDELVSRKLEITFGEPITPGPRTQDVLDVFRHRGLTAEAAALHGYEAVAAGSRIAGSTRQQAARLGIDIDVFAERLYTAWIGAPQNADAFKASLAEMELRLAGGERAILVVDDRTGFAAPLARTLRQIAKAKKDPIVVNEPFLRELFPALPQFIAARNAGLDESAERARQAIDAEIDRIAVEAGRDRQLDLVARLAQVRARERDKRRKLQRTTLTARRAEIIALYRRRDAVRRARVDRAWRFAKIGRVPAVRKIVFATAAGVVVLAGGGLGAALVAGGMAVAVLPSFERARMLSALAANERIEDKAARDELLSSVYAGLTQRDGVATASKLDFRAVDKRRRIVVGFIAQCSIRAEHDGLDAGALNALAHVKAHFGDELIATVREAVMSGPEGAALRLLGWYRWDDDAAAKALNAAVAAAGERAPQQPEGRER